MYDKCDCISTKLDVLKEHAEKIQLKLFMILQLIDSASIDARHVIQKLSLFKWPLYSQAKHFVSFSLISIQGRHMGILFTSKFNDIQR